MNFTNLAVSKLLTGIASTDLTLTLLAGDGDLLFASSNQQIIVFSDAYANASLAYKAMKQGVANVCEIMTVSSRTADICTVNRAQEGTTACNFNNTSLTYTVIAPLTSAGIASLTVDTSPFSKGMLLIFGGVLTVSGVSIVTRYAIHGSGDANCVTQKYHGQIPVPAGTVKSLRVWQVANASTPDVACTVQKNGVSTSMTVNCTAPSGTGKLTSDTNVAHQFTTVAGDLIGVEAVIQIGSFSPAYMYYVVEMVIS